MSSRSRRDANSVTDSWINGPNIQIGSAGNVTLALGRPDYQVQWLQTVPRDGRVPRGQRTPSHLLDASREVVPFWPRPAIQDTLTTWRDDPEAAASILLVHGAGGRGKTRLANAFAGQSHELGWAVARAVSRVASPGDVVPEGPATGPAAGADARVLVVVDYAERWPVSTLAELIQSLVLEFAGRILRVLLLARSRGQVWQPLGPLLGRHIDVLDPVELGPVAATPAEREKVFNEAAAAFQAALDLPPTAPTPPELTHDDYSNVLLLHMAALAAVTADRDHQARPSRTDLSSYLLEHEQRHWPLTSPTDSGVTLADATDSVFLATLFGPLPNAEAATTLLTAAGHSDPVKARAVLSWHDTLYPQHTPDTPAAPSQFPALAPLRPDRFGEDFVAQRLTEPRTTERLHQLLEADHELLDDGAVRRCLLVLAPVADRHEHTRATLWTLLHNPRIVARANATVIQTAIDHAPLTTCQHLEKSLPRYRTDLLQVAAALTTHILHALPPTTPTATRAAYLNNLGNRLADAGDKQAALAPAREAVELYRALVEADRAAYLPDLASSLNNLGGHLAGAGDKQAALAPAREAVTIRRALAEADRAAYLPDLAMSMWALAWGQTQEPGPLSRALDEARACAEEACELYEQLTQQEPRIFNGYLQAAQNTLALVSQWQGRSKDCK